MMTIPTTNQTAERHAICNAILRSIYCCETVEVCATLDHVEQVARSAGDDFSSRIGEGNCIDVGGYTNLFPDIESGWRLRLYQPTT